jgi:hypothetical protein
MPKRSNGGADEEIAHAAYLAKEQEKRKGHIGM